MKKNIYIIGTYLLFIALATFPLLFKIQTCIPGFVSSDEPFGALWDSWRIKYSILHHLSLSYTQLIIYPSGLSMYSSGYCSYVWFFLTHALSLVTTPVLTYNLQIILNLFLSMFLVYLLVLHLTKSKLSAFFSGMIFGLCPYQFVRSWQHLGLTYNQLLPLVILAAILLKEKTTKKQMAIFIISLILLYSFDWSIMFLGSITLGSFLLYLLAYNWRKKFFGKTSYFKNDLLYLKQVTIAGLITGFLLLPQFFPVIINFLRPSMILPSAENPFHRPFEDLFVQSVRPLSYLLPAFTHPFFGRFTEQFIGSALYGTSLTEHTLYLGWIPILLAFIGTKKWLNMRRRHQINEVDNFYIGFFIFLAATAWFFSQPPWWQFGQIRVYMPSFFIYKILPMYRAYCRFGIVLMFAVAVLAGFGLKFFLQKFRAVRSRVIVAILCTGLLLFEFWNWPPYKVIDVSRVPEVYYWIKNQPGDFVVVEYPLDYNGPNEMYKFYQTTHEKKIINGIIPRTYPNDVANTIKKLSDPKTSGVLKWMGVKYVIVHRDDYLRSEIVDEAEELQKIPKNPGLKLIKSFPAQECPDKNIMCIQKTGPIDVYLVCGEPIEPSVKK